MKRTTLLVVGLLIAGLTVAYAGEGTEAPWFDMENCAFCKNVVAEPGLLEAMTWKNYDITSGVMTVTTVKPDHKEAYMRAHRKMEELGTKMMNGEVNPTTVKMCGHCQAYGAFMMKGVVFDYVQADFGDVVLMTSASPETVAEIRQFAKRNEEETKKMKKEMKAKKAQ